jgi:hypothetical protein
MQVGLVPGPPLSKRGGGEKSEYISCCDLRVGACANELRLMGVERGSTLDGVSRAFEDRSSVSRKKSSAWAPPAMQRMWQGPNGEGAS